MKQTLLAGLSALNLKLTDEQADTMCAFGEAMLEKNQVMNLTAITAPEAVAQLHFLDSMAILNAVSFEGKSVIDVGCGAGYPGVPLKIAEGSVRLTLLDSLGKRMNWLSETLAELDISAACVTARAEEHVQLCRERFDIATSRAVARMNILCELCMPFVKVGGSFVAMKSLESAEELEEAKSAIHLLGGQVERIYEYPIAGTTHRAIVISKVRPTPSAYPRTYAAIKKKPL